MSRQRIPPSPPNPHLAVMPVAVDTTNQPQYVTSPSDEIKLVNYPFNWVKEFTLTCYGKVPLTEGDEAVVYDSEGKELTRAPLNSGAALSFESLTYYPILVKFNLPYGLPSRDIKVTVPVDLLSPSGGRDLKFKFDDYVVEDPVQSI